MAKLATTVGALMINEALPPDMRDYGRVLDKKKTAALLQEVAERYPEQYSTVLKKLMDAGREIAVSEGSQSFGIEHLKTTQASLDARQRMKRRLRDILAHSDWDDKTQAEKIVESAIEENDRLLEEVPAEASKAGNPLAEQVTSGSRGNVAQLKRLIGGDVLYTDHRDRAIPFPVMKTYSEGLTPAEYWAASFGARKGLVSVKLATQKAGYLSKQINQLAHRLMTTAVDDDAPYDSTTLRGLPVSTDDNDSEGALLADKVAGYPRNTLITPKILQDIRQSGVQRILVRSPTVGGPEDGGVYARDVGVRERSKLTPLGEMVGLAAAQALGEPVSQGMLGAKHVGGTVGGPTAATGYPLINAMLQVPKNFPDGATHAQEDGTVHSIREAPAGGYFVTVGSQEHYVPEGLAIKVRKGDHVEAGDVLSGGIPNPSEIVKHKGIGEGRRYFVDAFTKAYRDGGLPAHRRNVELVARGLINHVELTDETDDYIPGDVVPYHRLEKNWTPRQGHASLSPKQAIGKYLEKPVLHYTIGTRIQPSVVKELDHFGVNQVLAHDDPPPFNPIMVRAMSNLEHDEDWMSQFLGAHQKSNLLEAARRGGVSDINSSSFVPAMASGVEIGKIWPNIALRPSAK